MLKIKACNKKKNKSMYLIKYETLSMYYFTTIYEDVMLQYWIQYIKFYLTITNISASVGSLKRLQLTDVLYCDECRYLYGILIIAQ